MLDGMLCLPHMYAEGEPTFGVAFDQCAFFHKWATLI